MKPGIYLLTVLYCQGGYLVTYVGETSTSFGQRIKEYLIQTLGGNYRICDPDRLCHGEAQVLWDGLWRKGTRDKMPEYLERLEELVPILRKCIQTERIFMAPLHITRRLQQRIEGAIAEHIKAQPAPASSVLPSGVRYYRRRADEKPVSVVIECPCDVHGLPPILEA
jgi:hypothetical protein